MDRFAAVANGDELDAKASNPERFRLSSGVRTVGAGARGCRLFMLLKSADAPIRGLVPVFGLEELLGNGVVLVLAHGDDLVENRLGPLTVAKGELVDA